MMMDSYEQNRWEYMNILKTNMHGRGKNGQNFSDFGLLGVFCPGITMKIHFSKNNLFCLIWVKLQKKWEQATFEVGPIYPLPLERTNVIFIYTIDEM